MRELELDIPLVEPIGTEVVAIPAGAEVELELRLESVHEGILATGEIFAEAGEEISAKSLVTLVEAGFTDLPILDIDHINVGPYIRNTLAADKCRNREDALVDIYRVMRPGEPPTLESADALFRGLFFDMERYDLSPVGRVKMNARLGLSHKEDVGVLTNEDIVETIKLLVGLKDGIGEVDDIDHLGNRRVRSVGELMENQFRLGLLRMERAIKERTTSSSHSQRADSGGKMSFMPLTAVSFSAMFSLRARKLRPALLGLRGDQTGAPKRSRM